MIRISDKTKCCGCTACYSSCPENAIKMKADNEGFLYPNVDKEKCISCGLCERVCPYHTHNGSKKAASEYYAVQHADEDKRSKSTAGGAFSLIADFLLGESAVVFAADYDSMIVCHKKATDSKELAGMRGSKYVQSNLGETFSAIKNLLQMGRTVLFVGTPCQTHGLFNYIGQNENLYIMDLLCLGVSSPGLFSRWIEYLNTKYQSKVINVQFRNKHYGYSVPNVRVYFENGKEFDQRYDSKVHANLFFQHLNVRPSCYICKFRESPRISDFTIGDFNNIGSVHDAFDDDLGTTKLWVHTEKGKDVLNHVRESSRCFLVQTNQTNIIGGPGKMFSIPEKREAFFEDARNMRAYSELVKKWEPQNVKSVLVSAARPIINMLPFKSYIFKALRRRKNAKFQKTVKEVNS